MPWFAPGRWVEVDDPWLGPDTHGCSTTPGLSVGKSVEMDPETMKLALRITFGDDKKIGDLLRRVPRRPWYARHLVANPAPMNPRSSCRACEATSDCAAIVNPENAV